MSIESVAKGAEQGGAAMAVSAFAAWGTGITRWLDAHSAAVLAICGVVGMLISVAGFLVNWYYKHKRFEFDLRQKSRRL